MTLPFNNNHEKVTITVPSGHDFQVVYPTTIEDVHIAIGRIGQDIRDPEYMGETTVGVTMGRNNGIIITRADEKPIQFDLDGEASIPNTFRIAMRYLGNTLGADHPSNLTLLNFILERRLGVTSSAPRAAVMAEKLKPQ